MGSVKRAEADTRRERTNGCRILAAIVLASSVPALAAPDMRPAQATRPSAQTLDGAEAWRAMLGNTITGTTPDGAFSEYFVPDGRFVHLDRDGPATGTWTLNGDQVCFAYPDEEEVECRKPELGGRTGAFTGTDGARYPFELEPGNPKGL